MISTLIKTCATCAIFIRRSPPSVVQPSGPPPPGEGTNGKENLIDSYLLTGSYLQTGRRASRVWPLCSALADYPDRLRAESGDGDDA